ncbi:hypothetical protein [Marinobacter sp.]|uniref:hypothetical protein n=1 Tax=Marinobacter sp. TaxID=50741 RepID=UPI0035C6B172
MNKLVISVIGLALSLPVTSSLADEWERQTERHQMMMEEHDEMRMGDSMRQPEGVPGQRRQRMMERGEMNTIDDIENMPPTAAGHPDEKHMDEMNMEAEKGMKTHRKGHRGEVESDY